MKFNQDYKSRFRILKGGKISLVISTLLGSITLSFASPSGGTVTSGNASISVSGTTTTISQATSKASINWQSFSIAANETVNFVQPDINSITLNRVIGNETSIIHGALNANGQVWILNSNGVLFGRNTSINTAGLLATTKNLSDANFNAGNYNFQGTSTQSVVNLGSINIKDSGYAVLLANLVTNDGSINVVKGKVHLTGAEEVTINLNGNSLVNLTVNKGVLDAYVQNKGAIYASAGEIYLTTNTVNELLKGVVNNTGILEANSIDGITGKINISSNIIINNGEITAQAGSIKIKTNFLNDAGLTDVSSIHKKAGTISINALQIRQSSKAILKADSINNEAGTISIISDVNNINSDFYLSGNISAQGKNGGNINITANKVALVGAKLDASGENQAGTIKLGGDWQGAQTSVSNSKEMFLSSSTQIKNSGNNGTIVVWSDEKTEFSAKILAKKTKLEVSSKENLAFNGSQLEVKSILLDPKNIEIVEAGSALSYTKIDASNSSGTKFGKHVLELSNKNFVITHEDATIGSISNVGAVYLYAEDGTLISTLTGAKENDNIGSNGITALTNGNYVVRSSSWDNGTVENVGAVTWGNSASGINGLVDVSNSLVGTQTDDKVGDAGITALTNGNYVVRSSSWDNGTVENVGAVTWANGTTGINGSVDVSNSLVGTQTDDKVGDTGITALTNGNYVVSSSFWDNASVVDAGAVTWANGTTGINGSVDASNSLVGTQTEDKVGFSRTINYTDTVVQGITALNNGNYVVISYKWDNASLVDVGAVTWADGTTGISGEVSASNSLVGRVALDEAGRGGVTSLTNGNYVVSSSFWNQGSNANAGAVTWANGTTGLVGEILESNSLYGTKQNDLVGYSGNYIYRTAKSGVTALTNGNYVVSSSAWGKVANSAEGAVTLANGLTGLVGPVTTTNSLVGSDTGSRAGSGGITALTNGNYLAYSPSWYKGTSSQKGAVTWANGTTGLVGEISRSNSLIGSTSTAKIGSGGITALSNGNYVISSPYALGSTFYGAVTWGNGTTGISGVITRENSLHGTGRDYVGMYGVTALNNGNYLVNSPYWNYNRGAITWVDGNTGLIGEVTKENSLVGTGSYSYVKALNNGNYLVVNRFWKNGDLRNAGAITWGDGDTGLVANISSSNSLVGTNENDTVGLDTLVKFNYSDKIAVKVGNSVYLSNGVFDDISNTTFSNNPSSNSQISTKSILDLLNAGTDVTLQANNDITLSHTLIANNIAGDGGKLTFQAGRNININNNITTDNADFIAIAGDSAADTSNTDSGTPTITIKDGVEINTGTQNIIFHANDGKFVNNTSANPFISNSTSIYLPSYTDGSLGSLTLAKKRYNTSYGDSYSPISGLNLLYEISPVLKVAYNNIEVNYGDDVPYDINSFTMSGYVNGDNKTSADISGVAIFNNDATLSSTNKEVIGVHNVTYDTGLLSELGYTFEDDVTSVDELKIVKKPIIIQTTPVNLGDLIASTINPSALIPKITPPSPIRNTPSTAQVLEQQTAQETQSSTPSLKGTRVALSEGSLITLVDGGASLPSENSNNDEEENK